MTDAITRATLTHLQVPLKEPFRTARGEVAIGEALLVTLETESGRVGVGEGSPTAGSPESIRGCWDDLSQSILPGLLGQDVADEEGIAGWASGWSPRTRAAVAGAETACWDLLAQGRHESLAEALGATADRVDAGVESGLTVGLEPTVVDLLRLVERHLDEGYRRLTLAIAPGHDVECVRAVRQHFGDDLPLMVQADASYGRDDLDLFRRLDDLGLLMIEQPLPADDLDGLAAWQAALATPICLVETATDPARLARALQLRAGRVVNLKLRRLGGFGPSRATAALCRDQGVACWVGMGPDLGVGQAQALHLAALAACKYPADVEPSARRFMDDVVAPLIEFARPGLFEVPTRPGLGYQVDPSTVRRYRVRHEEFLRS